MLDFPQSVAPLAVRMHDDLRCSTLASYSTHSSPRTTPLRSVRRSWFSVILDKCVYDPAHTCTWRVQLGEGIDFENKNGWVKI